MNHEDELIDALLKEQAKNREADETLLSSIEGALDEAGTPPGRERQHRWKESSGPRWRAVISLTAAAAVVMGIAVVVQRGRDEMPDIAYHQATPEKRMETPAEMVMEANEVMRSKDAAMPEMKADLAPERDVALQAPPAAAAEPRQRAEVIEDAFAPVDELASLGQEVAPLREQMARTAGKKEGESWFFDRDARLGRAPAADAAIAPDSPRWAEELPRGAGVFGDLSRENYGRLVDQPWKSSWDEPLSTFSIDVDNASYTNLRRMIREGRSIQPDAVRIEECVNYFDYAYEPPSEGNAFAVHTKLATCPWKPQHLLARVAIKGREIETNARPASNLVFLIDVSGSMQSADKLPLLKRSMQVLIDSLDERDRVGIVVYAGSEGVVLEPTLLDEAGKSKAAAALAKLESGGSTNGGAGLARAYRMAVANKVGEGVNRVILATDGDFNVGTTGQGQLVEMVKSEAAKGVSLSVLGFGTGNLNDSMLEAITNDGNGNYFYVDGEKEAERIFLQKLTGTLVTIAKDVKIQVEFNPGKVKAYRLIGYANRVLRNQDFNDDKVDAGDIGAGHTVTAFYEIVPVGVAGPDTGDVDGLRYQKPSERGELTGSDDWFTLKLRYKHPEGEVSKLIEAPVKGEAVKWEEAGNDFRMASAVALFGMKLRNLPEAADLSWEQVSAIAKPALSDDPDERRAEFLELIKTLEGKRR